MERRRASDPVRPVSTRSALALAAASAAAAVASLPFVWPWAPDCPAVPGGLGLLAFVALVPLLRAVDGRRVHAAFGWAWGAATAAFVGIGYWVHGALTTFGGVPSWASAAAVLLLAAGCGLFWAAPVAFAAAARARGLPAWLVLPPAWVAAEFARGQLLPWGDLGYALARETLLVQVASLGGVYAATFLVVLGNGALYEALAGLGARRPTARRSDAAAGAGLTVTAAVLALAAGWGAHRVGVLDVAERAAPAVQVALIQGNLDQRIKNEGERRARLILASHAPPAAAEARAGADLVIWPESVWPGTMPEGGADFRSRPEMAALTRADALYLLSGDLGEGKGAGRVRRNAAFLVDRRLEILGRYDKHRLVPFGEYVPLPGLGLEQVVPGRGRFVPGTGRNVLRAPPAVGRPELRLGTLICFDAVFPDLARSLGPEDPNLLVNQSNDAWYGRSSAPWQFLDIAALRAVENGRWLARAANTGVSAFVDPAGRVVARTGLGLVAEGAARVDPEAKLPPVTLARAVPLLEAPTVYRRVGDLFAWTCVGLTAGLAGVLVRRRRRRSGPQLPPARTLL